MALAGHDDFMAVILRDHDGRAHTYAQASRLPADTRFIAAVFHAADVTDPFVGNTAAMAPLIDEIRAIGAEVHLWFSDPSDHELALAERLGMHPHRSLYRMDRPLPVDLPFELVTRSFVSGADDEAFLEVNRRSFSEHPEQGDMTLDLLHERLDEPWYDPSGFLLTEVDGRLAGFCWTKTFPDQHPPSGEIFIIGVHPDFFGQGLGKHLVLAGLDHLHRQGMQHGFLFVEGNNAPAVGLYERLGFEITRADRAFAIAADGNDGREAPR